MTRGKLGRNAPCWCGSEIKYKRCHLDRESQSPLALWDASDVFTKAFSEKKCLAPDAWLNGCRGKISRAHTVPKSGSLQRIARNGHVYSFIPRLEDLQKHEGKMLPRLLGVNRASTFTGFCSEHDNSIFEPLEKKTFAGTREQCFLLSYRALAREIYTKMAASHPELSKIRRAADKGRPLTEQIALQRFNQLVDIGLSFGLKDLDHYKHRYDKILESRQFDAVRGYVIEFEAPPLVMCSCAPYPEQDFNGIKLQTVADPSRVPDILSITSFYGGEKGIAVFSWLADNNRTCCAFIESLKAIPDDFVTAALLRFFFTYSENIHMAPGWWEELPGRIQDALVKRMKLNTDFANALPRAVLADDGISFAPWTVAKRYEI